MLGRNHQVQVLHRNGPEEDRIAQDHRSAKTAAILERDLDWPYIGNDLFGAIGNRNFAFFRLEPTSMRYVGGFGRMSWVTADAYAAAEPDPLAEVDA